MKSKPLSVRARLYGGFTLVVLAGLGISIYARLQLDMISSAMEALVQTDIVRIAQVQTLKDRENDVARVVREMALMSDDQDLTDGKNAFEQAQNNATQLMDLIRQAGASSDDESKFLDVALKAREDYLKVNVKAVGLSLDKKHEDVLNLFYTDVNVKQKVYLKSLADLSESRAIQMQGKVETLQKSSHVASMWMIGVATAATILGYLVAWAIVRSFTRELGGEPHSAAMAAYEMARGNLSYQTDLRMGDTTSVLAAMNVTSKSLSDVVYRVRDAADAVANGSKEIAQGNQDLSSRTESQASALQQTAASMEQLGSIVNQNAQSALHANQLSQVASDVAAKGGEMVYRVVETMKGINEASRKIGDIIGVIDGIAFQTNILALNAAVEAARAGEQGRGFAVVASEVRSLAGRSADAAREIKALISTSVDRVTEGSTLVDSAGATMREVVDAIHKVTDIVGEINVSSAEQSRGVAQIGDAVRSLDQTTQQNAALVEEMAAAAASLQTQALGLVDAVQVFKVRDDSGVLTPLPMT